MWVAFGTTLKILGPGFFFVCTCDICAILENWCREKLPSQRPPICAISETSFFEKKKHRVLTQKKIFQNFSGVLFF